MVHYNLSQEFGHDRQHWLRILFTSPHPFGLIYMRLTRLDLYSMSLILRVQKVFMQRSVNVCLRLFICSHAVPMWDCKCAGVTECLLMRSSLCKKKLLNPQKGTEHSRPPSLQFTFTRSCTLSTEKCDIMWVVNFPRIADLESVEN